MKTNYLFITCGVAIFIGLQSCNKTDSNLQTVYLPKAIKDYAYFKQGTTWVYEDSSSGKLDSIYVYNAYIENYSEDYRGEPALGIYEELEVFSKSKLDSSQYHVYVNGCYCAPNDFDGKYIVNYAKTPTNGKFNRTSLMKYPFTISETYPAGVFGESTLVDSINNYVVNGKTYQSVLIYHNTSDVTMGNDSTLTWIANHYGIIRKQNLSRPKTFWLKQSTIIQ